MQNSILLSEIFGWMSLINVGLLSVASLALIWWGDKITSIHSRLLWRSGTSIKKHVHELFGTV
ncbi:hypothetical protein P4S73_26355 [Paraglaciecola sp. Hal342]